MSEVKNDVDSESIYMNLEDVEKISSVYEDYNSYLNISAFHRPAAARKNKVCTGNPTAVCLGLLCVLLLILLIIIWIKHDLQRNEFQSSYINLTLERDELQSSYVNLTKESNQLKTRYNALSVKTDAFKKMGKLEKFGGSYYFISAEQKTWSESRNDCMERGGNLVIINSKKEQEFISSLRLYVWIGLTDAVTEGTWIWVDGSPLDIKFWKLGEPNDAHKNEDCAVLNLLPSNTWNDISCSEKAGVICEIKLA